MRKSALLAFGLVVTALVLLGLLVLSSASGANAMRYHNGDAYFFMRRQFEYLAVGIVVVVVVARFDYHKWRDHEFLAWAFFAIVFAIFSLVKNRTLLRNAFLFFVSLFFYYKTSGLFTLILIFITLYNFFGPSCLRS